MCYLYNVDMFNWDIFHKHIWCLFYFLKSIGN